MAGTERSTGATPSGNPPSRNVRGDRHLKRELGFWHLTGIALGGVIGSGWLLAPVRAAHSLGTASVAAWVIGAAALVLPSLVLVELGVTAPLSGGLVRWPFHTSGGVVGAFASWMVWIAYAINPPAEALAALQYINSHWTVMRPDGRPNLHGQVLGLVILLIFGAVNWFGIRLFAQVNLAVTAFKVVVPALVAALFLWAAYNHHTGHGGGPAPHGTADGVLPAIVGVGIFFAYSGFQGPLDVAGEARSAKSDIRRAVFAALAIPTLLYVVLQIAVLAVSPPTGHAAHAADLIDLAGGAGLGWLALPLAITAALSTSGSSGVYITESSRTIYAMGLNALLSPTMGAVHRKSGVPRRAVVANLLVGVLILFTFRNWITMITVLAVLTLIGYSLSLVSEQALRRALAGRRAPDDGTPPPAMAGLVRGTGVLAPVGFTVMTLLVYWSSWGHLSRLPYVFGAGAGLLGLLALVLLSWLRRPTGPGTSAGNAPSGAPGGPWRSGRDWRSAGWLVFHLAALFTLAVVGHAGHLHLIPSPWDSVLAAALGFADYAWALRSAAAHLRADDSEIDRLLGHAAA